MDAKRHQRIIPELKKSENHGPYASLVSPLEKLSTKFFLVLELPKPMGYANRDS